MPLKIQLRPKERVIINGAVIEGNSDSRTEITIMNKVMIMRQKHIINEKEADTPSKRLYFTLQMMYIDPENIETYKDHYTNFYKDLNDTVSLPTLKDSLRLIDEAVEVGKFYDAMKICRELIKVEAELLKIATPEIAEE